MFSLSLSRQKFKTWLESVMAENKAQFSDRQWNEQFRQKVLHDFERKQDEREKKLADAESQRILKLKLLGIIRDEGEEARREELAMRKTSSEKKFYRRTTRKHHSLFQPNDIETQMEILNRDEGEIKARNRTQNENGEGTDYNSENAEDQDDVDGRNMTYKSHLGRTKVDKKDEHPQLRQLYEEEDLRQLYRGAATLVKRTQRSK